MRNILYNIGKLSNLILRPIFHIIEVCIKYLRTGFITYKIKSIGQNTTISEGCNIVGGENICIGNRCVIGKHTTLSCWHQIHNIVPDLVIGNSVSIGEGCHITCANKIVIEDNALLGKYITITDNSHGDSVIDQLSIAPIRRPLNSKGPVIIGENVWIGDKVTILPNVKVGHGAIIGANSVVSKDIPANCVAVGIPAQIIRRIQ